MRTFLFFLIIVFSSTLYAQKTENYFLLFKITKDYGVDNCGDEMCQWVDIDNRINLYRNQTEKDKGAIMLRKSLIKNSFEVAGHSASFYEVMTYDKLKVLQIASDEPYITEDYAYVQFKFKPELTKHLLFQTYKYAVLFQDVYEKPFFTSILMDEKAVKEVYKKMVEDIRFTGKYFKEQNDSQNMLVEKDSKYKGKKIFDVMMAATEQDLTDFLGYVSIRPYIYMGNKWKISEVFATWVMEGAPQLTVNITTKD